MSTSYLMPRDLEILTAVERCPLTVRTLKALSVTLGIRFESDRRVQDRLLILTRAGLLRRFRYATTEGMGQFYYTLSPEGYRLLHGPDAPLPSPGLFREVGIARQHHTKMLADFIVHTTVAAHQDSVELCDFARENTLQLSVGSDSLYPDCAFTLGIPDLGIPDRLPFQFYAEVDNSTEPLASPRAQDSWLKKLRFYEALQDERPTRFRVLALVTKSEQRVRNLLALASAQAKNPYRALVYGIYLPHYLQHSAPLFAPIFTDHRGQAVRLLPPLAAPPVVEATPTLFEVAQPATV